jgi:hypothetical protein
MTYVRVDNPASYNDYLVSLHSPHLARGTKLESVDWGNLPTDDFCQSSDIPEEFSFGRCCFHAEPKGAVVQRIQDWHSMSQRYFVGVWSQHP